MMPKQMGTEKYEKSKLHNKQNGKQRKKFPKILEDKYVEMLISKDVKGKNRGGKKCGAWEEKGKTNKYIVHLQKLYKEFKFEECLNYGLENIEKLEKKNYVGKIEFLKIIGNVYFYLENYKYSSLTYILLSKYLNRVSDKYKVEICYNAGVVFIKYFLQSNDITYYLNAKTSFHCSMLYNENGSKHFNPIIYENTVSILKRHFPLGVKEQVKGMKNENNLFPNSSDESIFLESGTDLTVWSDVNDKVAKQEGKNTQGEDPQTKVLSSLGDSKSCTLKGDMHKGDKNSKERKGKNQDDEEDIYFDSNNTETFSIYDNSVDMRDSVLRKSEALAKEEKTHTEGRSSNIQMKEDIQENTVQSDHKLVNVSNEGKNMTNNFCNNLKNILFRNPVKSLLNNTSRPFVKSKSSSFLKSTPGSILKNSSYKILKKSSGSIVGNSPMNFISKPTGNVVRSSSSNFFNSNVGENTFVGSPMCMVRSNEGNFVNNSSSQFLTKDSSYNISPSTPRFLPSHSTLNLASNSPISFANNQTNILQNKASTIFGNNFPYKRMPQQKSIIKCIERSTDGRIHQEGPKALSNSNECKALEYMSPIENGLLQHKRRKTNQEIPLSASCERNIGVSNDLFLRSKDNKMCTFDYWRVKEKEGIIDKVKQDAMGHMLLQKTKSGSLREEAQEGKSQRSKAKKEVMEEGKVEREQIQDETHREENPKEMMIKRGNVKKDKDKKGKTGKGKSRRPNTLFDKLFSNESFNGSLLRRVRKACKLYQTRLMNEYYHIYYLKNKKKKVKKIIKRKRIADFFHYLYEICKKNKHDFLMKFVDQEKRSKGVSHRNATRQGAMKKGMLPNDKRTLNRREIKFCTGKISPHECNEKLKTLDKGEISREGTRKGSVLIPFAGGRDRCVKEEGMGKAPHSLRNYEGSSVNLLEMNCIDKGGRKKKLQYEQRKKVDMQRTPPFDLSRFVNLYSQIRSGQNQERGEKYQKEKMEIEEIIILSINKINKKRIRDKVKKLSSYNNSILSNIGDKFIDDMNELFLIKNYAKILKGLKRNDNIKHIYYLYENMYAIDKFDHINGSNFFNISHFIIDILLLKQIKEKDYLKKKIHKMKYSYQNYYAIYDCTDSGALFKDILPQLLIPTIKDTNKDDPKTLSSHIMSTENSQKSLNFLPSIFKDKKKEVDLNEQNDSYINVKFSSTTTINNSDTISYTNQKKEELLGERMNEVLSGEKHGSEQASRGGTNSCLSLRNHDRTSVKEDGVKSGTGDTSDTTYGNKPILRDFLSISSSSQRGESNASSISCMARAYKCEMEKVYLEMSKEEEGIFDVEKFYEHMNVSNASNDEDRIRAEEVILMLFYHYCNGGGDCNSSVSRDRNVSGNCGVEYTIRRALFKIFFFFISNGIINKKNLHEYVSFLRLYQFYLDSIKCDPLIYFYHNIEKDSEKIMDSIKGKAVIHDDFTSSIMLDNYLNVIHCHLYMLKLLYKSYLNKLKRKHTYDKVNLEFMINHTFSILNYLLIKYSYDERGRVVRRRVVFLFLQFLYLNSKYYFKNVTFFLNKYDINYLIKSETGNFCKINADLRRAHSVNENTETEGPNGEGESKIEIYDTQKEMGEENAKRGTIPGKGEKGRSSEEDGILDNQGDANEEGYYYCDEERVGGVEELLYEGISNIEEEQDRGRKCKEALMEKGENQCNRKDAFVDKEEWKDEFVSKNEQLKKGKNKTHNSSISNMNKFKNVFTKLDENVNIAFSSFLKCYHKCFFILNLRLHENDMFRKIVWKVAQRIVTYCNDLYTILKIKKIPINRSYNYVFEEINDNLYRKNIFLKPSFFKVLREDNYVNRIYGVHKEYIEKEGRRRVASHGMEDLDQNDVLNILITFAKFNRAKCQREKMNKKKKQFIFLLHSYKYIKKFICKELKENSILTLYRKAKRLDENFNQSIDYLHSLFDTRLCLLSLDFELQNIIIEFLNRCMEFVQQYQQEQNPRFVIINKMMNVYSCVFSLFYLRLNTFSEFHTNKLFKILGIEKNIFSYDDQATWHMLNLFNFVNFRYGSSYRFLNSIFTSFHVLLNVLVKIDIHMEMDRKCIGSGRYKRDTQISSEGNTYGNAMRQRNYEQVQKIIEREKMKKERRTGLSQSMHGVRFGKGIIYKIVKEVKKKVTVSGKLKIKNSIFENIIGKKMNRYFVNPFGEEVRTKKLERRVGELCKEKRMEKVGVLFNSTFCGEEKSHLGEYCSDPLSTIHTETQVETIAAVDRCEVRKRRIVVRAKGGMFHMSQFKHSNRNQRILQSYGKLKKIEKKLKRKINNVCFFKYIAVINKSQNKIYTTLSRTCAHILFILISILHIENYNILHLRKNQDFFINNDIYNTYYLFLHISSSIILLLSSVLKMYLHFNPSVRLDGGEYTERKLDQTKGLTAMAKIGKSAPNIQDEDGIAIQMESEEGGQRCRKRHLPQDGWANQNCRIAKMNNHTRDNNDGKFCIRQKEEESNKGRYQIYLETLIKFSSMNILLMSKKKYNKKNKMKKNKYIFIFCNIIENLLQNSMFYVDIFNSCKNKDILEMQDVFSKVSKLCKENNIMDDFMKIKNELIYHSLFKYILQEEYINHFNVDKNELYNMNKCSLNLFYFSLNILLTTFNTDISIHLERSLHNIHHFNHDKLYYEFVLNNVKRTVRYIRESSKSPFNCIFACVLYYLTRWKKESGKMLKGKNSEEKNILLRRNISNQRFASSHNMEEVKENLFFNLFSKEQCTDDTAIMGSVNNNWKGKEDSNSKFYIHPGEDSYGIFKRNEKIIPGGDKHVEKETSHLKVHQRNERKIMIKIVYDMISPYMDIKNIKVYNRIYRNNHTINSLINICFSFLFNNFLFLKPVYPFDIVPKEKNENESCGKKIRRTNYTLDIFSMKISDIKAVELFLSLYIHKYMQSICLDVNKLVDYNTYMNQFFWVSNRRNISVSFPCNDYTYLNYAARNVYYKFNDYNVLQFLINFKKSKSEGKEFMMSFVKAFERMISLDEEISTDYTDPLMYNVYLDYLNDLFLNDDYYYVCFYEYIKNVYLEENDGEFHIEDMDCYIKELNEINPYKIKEEMKRKFDEYVQKNYLLLTVRKNRRRGKSMSCEDDMRQVGKDIGEAEKKLISNGEERIKIVLNNNPYHFKNMYRAYRNRLFKLVNKKNINYLELIKMLNIKPYNHFSNMFYCSFIHILSEVKYDYNKHYNFNIGKIMDKLNIGLKASFYNNKNVILYYYTFQQYFHLYKFLEDKYFSEFVLPEYMLLNITSRFVNNSLYNTNLYRIYCFLKFLYIRNVLKHADILLNFLLYVYYKYFHYHYRGKDEFSHHFIDLFLSIHEESYNNSLLITELKGKDNCVENNLLGTGNLLEKNPLLGGIPVANSAKEGPHGEKIDREAAKRDDTNGEIITSNELHSDDNDQLNRGNETQSAYQEINNYHLVLSNSQNRFIHLLFFKILINCVKSKINILNAKNLFNNLNFFISSYVKYSLTYTFEERNTAFLDALRHKYSFYNLQAVKKNLKLCIYLKNVYLKRDLFNSDILSFLNIECGMKKASSPGGLSRKKKKKRNANFDAPQSMNDQFSTSQMLEHVRKGQYSAETLQSCSGLEYRKDENVNRKRTIGDNVLHVHDFEGSKKNEMNKKMKLLSGEACQIEEDEEPNCKENCLDNNVAEILTDEGNQIIGMQTVKVKREVEEQYSNVERTNPIDSFESGKKEEQEEEEKKNNPHEGETNDQTFCLDIMEDVKKGSHIKEDLQANQIKVKKEEMSDGNDTKVSIDSLTNANILRKQFFKKRSTKKVSKKYYINILKFYLANRAQGYALNYSECQKLEDKSIYLVFLFLGKIFQFLFNSLLSESRLQTDENKNHKKRERDMKADVKDAPECVEGSYTYENLLLYFMLISMCHYADSLIFLSIHFLDLHEISSKQSISLQGNSQQSSSQKGTLQNPSSVNEGNAALSHKEEMNTYNLADQEERNEQGNENQSETPDIHMKKLNYCEKLQVEKSPGKYEDSSNNSRNGCENNLKKNNLFLKPSLTSTRSYYMCRNEAVYIINEDKESTQMIIPLYKLLVTRLKICLYYPKYFFLASLFNYKYDTRLSDYLLNYLKDLNLSEGIKYYTYDLNNNGKGSTVLGLDGDCNGGVAKRCTMVDALSKGQEADHLGDHHTSGINRNENNEGENGEREANISRNIYDPLDEAHMLDHNMKNPSTYNEHAKNGTFPFMKEKQSLSMCVNYYTHYHENGNSNNCSFPSHYNSSNRMEYDNANMDMELTKQKHRNHVENTLPYETYERELNEKDMSEFNYNVYKLKVVIKNIEIRYEDVLNDIIEGLNFIAENKNCGNYNSQAAYHLCIYYFMRKNYTKCIHYMKFFINKGNFKIWQNESFNQDYYNLYCKRVQRSEFIFIKYFTIVLEVSKNVLKNVLRKIYEEMLCEHGNVVKGKELRRGGNIPCVDDPQQGDNASSRTDNFLCAHLRKFLVGEKVLELFKEEKEEEAASETPVKNADERKTDDNNQADGQKTEEHKTEKHKMDEQKTEEQKTEEHKMDEQKTEEQKTEEQKTEEDKTEEDKTEEHKMDEHKMDEQKTDEKETDENKTEEHKTDEKKKDEKETDEPKETNVNEYKGSPNKENENGTKERPIEEDITSEKNDPPQVAEAGNSMSNQKENKIGEIESKWIYLGYDHLDHLNEIYDILKILFEIYIYIGKTIKRFNDYKVLEEATVIYGSNISVINVLFKIITEHLCFIFEVLCYFTPHILVYPIILLFAGDRVLSCTVSEESSENVTETPPKSNTTPVSSKYTYLKRATNNEELIYNSSCASLDLRIFKLFREFLANKSATIPANLSTRMHNIFLLTCKKVLYYQKSEQDIIKNLSSYNKKGNRKKKEGIMKFVENALNRNKTKLFEFLNLFKNGKLLNCTNYLNCEDINFLTSKLNYNSSCKDMNKSRHVIHLDNNNVDKTTSQVDKENTISTTNDVGHELSPDANTPMLSKNDSVDEQKKKQWILYHIKLNNDKNILLYDDYDIFNNIKTKNEALNCVNSILSYKNSAAKKGETSNLKKRKATDSTITDVKNAIRERDLRRLNREKSKVV
ncbi:conserved Plasmodium protein, unknown function [Plasmodium knowlesi strain H]|uniref:Uncharacterized protein n=3 Tax=Plasmodium knowlesi TaxID=5850 RepID=A0A5K1V193_PLAKH|nr:conserved Plasmodium protein, unknown function [Plasmodium knowlesi strain H]OTN63824.1 Uncharacterized protein PKNOH_S140225900 [Plasmodium knowlesi]CAA9990687.1 conserved Plasmodium protein, unknown function [Plasmodium knowlesi strain H]SBO25922.1 conserved Plasmodium protein, unknown function [Plasmodium knowlesi strain H]SBO28671.1 conserved Plasmodium protein, unknown function [Plasmodium knowlesi strain H]VVS80161.1 conserved Plasmodium protein, unknown function [Plasmodium knowlesi |eukprot:XP_002261977.1 hypothetical protein, conserved in Plasmodium species [Plasmodium knowlesi strain H]